MIQTLFLVNRIFRADKYKAKYQTVQDFLAITASSVTPDISEDSNVSSYTSNRNYSVCPRVKWKEHKPQEKVHSN